MKTITVYVWPDTTWRYADEYSEEYDSWKGDDFVVVDNFDWSMTYEQIDKYIVDMFGGVTYDEIDVWCWERTKENFK